MAENRQLKETAAQAAQQQQEQQRKQQQGVGSAAEVAQLQAQLRQLQLESDTLRQQLRLSESLRRKGRKALTDLKQVGFKRGREAGRRTGRAFEGLLRPAR